MRGSIVTFGEILMRLSPPGQLRLGQAQTFDVVYGGAEANVAIALAFFGLPVHYVTRLPDNDLGRACLQSLRQYGVGCDFVEMGGDRLGLYFLEEGAGARPTHVIYDRAHSAFATLDETTIDWASVFAGAGWFHWSGICPAVSAAAAKVTAQAVAAARAAGLVVSCDLNYRHSLWQWGAAPATVMPDLVAQCQVLAANTASLMLGLPDVPAGSTPAEAGQACARLAAHYPNLKQITMTCRETVAAGQQRFTGLLWQEGRVYTSRPFALTDVVDRVGAGDAFMAGLIYGLVAFPEDPQRVVNFASACAVLKHTIAGDANLATLTEVNRLLGPDAGFDIIR
jgi:2-dehydro-3-deoxygluconokinase